MRSKQITQYYYVRFKREERIKRQTYKEDN